MTAPHWRDDHVTLYLGDCLDVLRALPDASVDAVVTDPPAGISFMGRDWDGDLGGRGRWIAWHAERLAEAARVLKPGGHALVWALPRTSHWTACAVEDAGLQIRDCITHLFASGFPKSMNVSKAIDKAAGASSLERVRRVQQGYRPNLTGCDPARIPVTLPATEQARQWDGWGTSLKPAAEHWWLARKPLAGTVAANVLEYGTGAIHIGACRVPPTGESRPRVDEASQERRYTERGSTNLAALPGAWIGGDPAGRWPTNVVLSHPPLVVDGEAVGDACTSGCIEGCPVAELDRQSGASRFFPVFRYEAKAPARERPKLPDGTTHPTVKPLALMRWLVRLVTPPGGLVIDPFAGSGTTGEAAVREGARAILIERETAYAELIKARLSKPIPTALFGDLS